MNREFITVSQISFIEDGEISGKCKFQDQECLYTCVNHDFTDIGSDPGDQMGYRLFRLSHARSGEVLGHYLKSFSK